jgi:hypothetical protein
MEQVLEVAQSRCNEDLLATSATTVSIVACFAACQVALLC